MCRRFFNRGVAVSVICLFVSILVCRCFDQLPFDMTGLLIVISIGKSVHVTMLIPKAKTKSLDLEGACAMLTVVKVLRRCALWTDKTITSPLLANMFCCMINVIYMFVMYHSYVGPIRKHEYSDANRLRGVGHIMTAIYYDRSSLFNIDPTKIDKITTDITWLLCCWISSTISLYKCKIKHFKL